MEKKNQEEELVGKVELDGEEEDLRTRQARWELKAEKMEKKNLKEN